MNIPDKFRYWATSGTTENGDELDILLWNVQPTPEQIMDAYLYRHPEETEDGIYWILSCAEIMD